MQILDIQELKGVLKGLDLNYLEGEKKDKILQYSKKAANEDKKKDDYVLYNPCEVVEIEKDKYYLVLAEMEDVEENFIFSTTAFLITESNGEFKYNEVFTGVECEDGLYASSNFFESVKHYKYLFKEDMTSEDIYFLIRDDIGEKANVEIFEIFKLYVNKMFDNIAADEEQEKALNELLEQSKGSYFTFDQ